MEKGVFAVKKKNGEKYFRASITFHSKHISLGSFDTSDDAHKAYEEAGRILYSVNAANNDHTSNVKRNADTNIKINFSSKNDSVTISNFISVIKYLSPEKAVSLISFRDNNIYIKTPIYLRKGYFSYFLFEKRQPRELKFSNDDLFYYSSHRILVHDGHLYVNDYGMQYGILARYGIKNFAVAGRDYDFANGDMDDFRYENIIIFSSFHGVICHRENGQFVYETRIKINGEFRIGYFESEETAAIAYNKAADFAKAHGIKKNFPQNYVDAVSAKEYAEIYTNVRLPEKFCNYFLL